MKKVIVLVCAVVLFASYSYAGILDSVKYYGEGSFYGYSSQGGGKGYLGGTTFYGTLGISANIYEDINAAFALGYSSLWGNRDGVYSMQGKSISNNSDEGFLNTLLIVEANVEFDRLFDIDGLKLKIGRQFYGDEDSMAMYFGVRRDQPFTNALVTSMEPASGSNVSDKSLVLPAITSLDAAVAYYENKNIKANAIFATLYNYSIPQSYMEEYEGENENTTIKGFDFKYLNISDMIDVQAYFYDIENVYYITSASFFDLAPMIEKHYDILGFKGTFHKTINNNPLKASLEIAMSSLGDKILSSDDKIYDTSIIKFDAAFNISHINLTPRASLGFYGGYDDKIGPKVFLSFGNYYPGLIGPNFIGLGLVSRQVFIDLTVVNLGTDYKLNKFSFSFDFFNFSHETKSWKSSSEIDLQAKYAYNEKIDINVGIAHLFEDDSDYDIAYYQAGLSYKF